MSDGTIDDRRFDLARIWKNEGVEEDLREFLGQLLALTNDLIKAYSRSDDLGEYSKKPELWDAIKESTEIRAFVGSADTVKILDSYLVSSESSEQANSLIEN
jgi:hypothetical protein